MKAIIYSLLIIMGFSNCAKKVNDFILKDVQNIEGIRIGMPINEAVKILNKRHIVEKRQVRILDDEPESSEYLVINGKKEKLFTFNGGHERKNKDNVFRIVITSPKYTTPEGIKVGMNIKELKEKTNIKSADFNFQDGLYIFSGKFDGGFWIHTDPKKQYKFNYEKPLIKDIPEELKIKGIVIF